MHCGTSKRARSICRWRACSAGVATTFGSMAAVAFTSYSDQQLREQLAGWVDRDGCRFVKMKIGSDAGARPGSGAGKPRRRSAIANCFVDANGAFSVKQALDLCASLRRGRHPLVRGAGDVRRSAGLAPDARTRARSDGHCRRRIHLYVRRRAPGAARLTPSTCCKPTPRDAAASLGFCRSARCAKRIISTCRLIARRRCTVTSLARYRGFATSNGSTITFGSNTCCSTARRWHATARSSRIWADPVTASSSSDKMPNASVSTEMDHEQGRCRGRSDR